MTATRSRKEELYYRKHRAAIKKQPDRPDCDFCAIKKGETQWLKETKYHKVIRNIFAYSIWDGQRVEDHLLVIPKRHTDTLADLNDKEAIDYVKLISVYESQGYNVYARAPLSSMKSVVHQHTHLIKTSGIPKKLVFLVRKPYIRVIF